MAVQFHIIKDSHNICESKEQIKIPQKYQILSSSRLQTLI